MIGGGATMTGVIVAPWGPAAGRAPVIRADETLWRFPAESRTTAKISRVVPIRPREDRTRVPVGMMPWSPGTTPGSMMVIIDADRLPHRGALSYSMRDAQCRIRSEER